MDKQAKTSPGSSMKRRNGGRRVRALLVVAGLLAGALAVQPARAASDRCTASGPVAAGWGGSRYVPVPPQGVGPSCILLFDFSSLGKDVRLTVRTKGTVGGQVIETLTGHRYFCRGSLEPQIGQDRNAYPVKCSSGVGVVKMTVPRSILSPFSGRFYCSTTGEIGVLADIVCEAV